MRETWRILDANFNRAREALRVAEDCGRFALNDPAITAFAKNLRSELAEVYGRLPAEEMLTSRNTAGDIGTELSSPMEPYRANLEDVAVAACKRLTEALRTIEECVKVVRADATVAVERMRYNAYTLEQRLIGRLRVAGRFAQVRLYVLLGRVSCRGSLREVARAVLAGGADAVQLRDKHVGDAELLAQAAELRELTDQMGALLIVNDRPDVAALVGADGVHLGQQDLPIAEARTLLRPGAVVGRSTHSPAQARAAMNEGADYIGVGPMFATDTKNAGPPAGPALLREVAQAVPLPRVAIGGITIENVDQVIEAGARCVAVSSAVCAAADPQAAARALRDRLDAAAAAE